MGPTRRSLCVKSFDLGCLKCLPSGLASITRLTFACILDPGKIYCYPAEPPVQKLVPTLTTSATRRGPACARA